jgi:ankyrin repeat protein
MKKYKLILLCLVLISTAVYAGEKEDQLLAAAKNGKVEIVRQLIKEGVDINAKDKDGDTALIYACDQGHAEIVKLLIEAKADVNTIDKDGNTALIAASNQNQPEIVKLDIPETCCHAFRDYPATGVD